TKFGSQVIVRENQAAIFFRDGKGLDVLGPGRHTLSTANIPIVTKILSLPWNFTSPFRVEVVFVNMKLFPDLKWGTAQPVAYRDADLGLVRLRAFGNYAIQIREPLVFVNALAGTMGSFLTVDIKDYLRDIIVSRLNDYLGEKLRTIFDLPSQYDEMGQEVHDRLSHDFQRYGINLADFFITSITPPEEVEKAIDERAQMAALGDLDKFLKMKAARALEGGGGGGGGAASDMVGLGAGAGMGAGIGAMLPGMIFEAFKGQPGQATGGGGGGGAAAIACPACHTEVAPDTRFCSHCGESLVAGDRCEKCEGHLAPDAKFCGRCGEPVGVTERACPNCGVKVPAGARFCMECGDRVE
ncbi:MAG: zinc-ribbon domain-containing protein, partial [Gemmatimonadetes bacterium]|nr:zinc-ribbon domain-containing protein [Gemmatimonadota bacterium]NIO30439.1 zinc-ribbon domain-containing protein [Gemmatimonadota bacterium]